MADESEARVAVEMKFSLSLAPEDIVKMPADYFAELIRLASFVSSTKQREQKINEGIASLRCLYDKAAQHAYDCKYGVVILEEWKTCWLEVSDAARKFGFGNPGEEIPKEEFELKYGKHECFADVVDDICDRHLLAIKFGESEAKDKLNERLEHRA